MRGVKRTPTANWLNSEYPVAEIAGRLLIEHSFLCHSRK